jgi:hypothetical protein
METDDMTTARATKATRANRLEAMASRPARVHHRRLVKTTAVAALLASLVLGPTFARAQAPVEPLPAPIGSSPSPPMPGEGVPPTIEMPPPPPPAAPPMQANPPPPPPPAAMTTEVPTAPLPPPPAPPSKIPSYLLWGAAGASLIVGASFGFAALSAKSDFDDNPTYAKADSVHNRAVIADVGLGLGAILAITGTIFFFAENGSAATADNHGSNRPIPNPASKAGRAVAQVHVVPLLSSNLGGGAFSVRF